MRTDEGPLGGVADWPVARERCLREAQRYTRCPVEAEDAVQEALLRAWKTRSKLRNIDHPMPWLLQITRNEALRLVARRTRDRERCVLTADPDARPATDEWTNSAQMRLDVQAALRVLTDDDRKLVSLRYGGELTHASIATLMNMPVGTCKVRLHRLRKRLYALLDEEGQGK